LPKFSVIIPALNEEKYIKYPLEGLQEQTFSNFEVIVVDGNSTDRTREVAKKYAKVIIDKSRGGAGKARNKGASIARGSYLVFIDADTKPSKNLLAEYLAVFENNKEVVAATGPVLPLEKTEKKVRAGFKFVSIYFAKIMLLLHRPTINGMNFAVRKSVFDELHGFNENFVTYEDWDLSHRLSKKGKVAYVKNAVVYTSTRRVKAWGVLGFAAYHIGNMLRYHLLKKPKSNYEQIR